MVFERISDNPYRIKINSVDISKIANYEKKVDVCDIINGNDISERLVNYLKPLIMGEIKLIYSDGIHMTLYRET